MNIWLRKFPTTVGVLLTFLIYFLTLSFSPEFSDTEAATILLGSVTFIFGIYLSFTISNSHSRLNKINELLKIHETNLLNAYKYSKTFGQAAAKHAQKLIDDNLVDQLDYYLVDFNLSTATFDKLYDYLISLEPKSKKEEKVILRILDNIDNASIDRKQVETYVSQKLSSYEWVSIFALLGTMLFLILNLNTGTTLYAFGGSILAAIMMLLIFILRDLDTLSWGQDKWIWEPMHQLFLQLDLLPYYPSVVLQKGEAKPPKGSKVRVAYHHSPYPNMKDKDVKVETIK